MKTTTLLETMLKRATTPELQREIRAELKKAQNNPKPAGSGYTRDDNWTSERRLARYVAWRGRVNAGGGDWAPRGEEEQEQALYKATLRRHKLTAPYLDIVDKMTLEELQELTNDLEGTFRDTGTLAPTAYLAGTVVDDGYIFNPYIHRTHLPLRVLEMVQEIHLNANGQEPTFGDYKAAVASYLARLPYWRAVSRGGKLCFDSAGTIVGLPTNGQRGTLRIPSRARFGNLQSALNYWKRRELRVLDNMCNHDAEEMIALRYGVGEQDVRPMLENQPRGNYDKRDGNINDLEGFDLYVWMGLYGAIRSMQFFPNRYDKILRPRGDWKVRPMAAFHLNCDDFAQAEGGAWAPEKSAEAAFDALSGFIERYLESTQDQRKAAEAFEDTHIEW